MLRNEFKNYKISVHEECSQLRTCLEESDKNICMLTTQLEEAKGMTDELKSIFDVKERICEEIDLEVETKGKECQNMKDEVTKLSVKLEKCQDKLKVRIQFDGSSDALEKMLKK